MTTPVNALSRPVARPAAVTRTKGKPEMPIRRQVIFQIVCIAIAITVLFPILWIVAMSLDPRDISRPDSLIPPGAGLQAYAKVIAKPTLNDIPFIRLALNSVVIALIISLASVSIGAMGAYAFSRMQFRGRQVLMIGILAVLMLPAVATIAPLFVQLNKITAGSFNLRASLLGVALAVTSSQLPFAIWNIKGYLDTIPRELEEAAAIDGAGRFQTFVRVILPLATPVLAVTAFFGFLAGWTEFYFSNVFLTGNTDLTTLAMALNGMVGQYAASTPWSQFAAFSVLVALPVSIVYLFLQRYIISGLTVGGVKG
jgi:arabinogalactan oligomer / maltooligosaccharide transport system permease protein